MKLIYILLFIPLLFSCQKKKLQLSSKDVAINDIGKIGFSYQDIKFISKKFGIEKKFLFLVSLFFIFSCNAQIRNTQRIQMKDYPAFYEKLTGNLNKVIAHKQDFYGKPLSLFLSELENQNIQVNSYTPGFDNTYMKLEFIDDRDTYTEANKNHYKMPYIIINLKTPFNYQKAVVLLDKNHSYWGEEENNFYKDLIIEDIRFMDVSGLKTPQLKAK